MWKYRPPMAVLLQWRTMLAGYAAAEVCFQAWRWYHYNSISEQPQVKPSVAAVPPALDKFFTLHGVIDVREFFSGWFRGAPFQSICRQNVEDFVVESIYCCPVSELAPPERKTMAEFVDRIERTWCFRFPPGRNAAITSMSHLHEPLRVIPVPLCVYLVSELCGLYGRIAMRRQGFTSSRVGGFSFWVKLPALQQQRQGSTMSTVMAAPKRTPHCRRCIRSEKLADGGDDMASAVEDQAVAVAAGSGNQKGFSGDRDARGERRPLVFLHGVGWGLFPYLRLLQRLCRIAPGHPVVVYEAPHLSLRLCGGTKSPSFDDMADAVALVLRRHDLSGACCVGHSCGTFAVSRLQQLHPELVHSAALLDPVCLMLCTPHLLSNFIYAPPQLSPAHGFGLNLLEVLRYMCARDLMISSTFCRGFYWHELMLWPNQFPKGGVTVAVSDLDTLVPIDLILTQLRAAGSSARVLRHGRGGHGGFLFDGTFQVRLIHALRQLLLAT